MDALARAASQHPGAPALVTEDGVITYAELDAAAAGVADLVAASGSLGDHAVAFWGDRTPEAVAAVWGVPRAGVAAVPVDPRMPPGLAMEMTRAAAVRGLWTPPSGGVEQLAARGVTTARGVGEYVVFTSGSEGSPKGVRLTQANVVASVEASQSRLGHGRDDAWLCVLPLFHVGGLSILWRQAAAAAPVVLQERFDPADAASGLGEVAFASFVPTMLRRVLEAGGTGHDRLRAVLIGGAASDVGLLEDARRVGIPAVPTYGMTETCSQVATPDPADPLDGSVGPALDGAEIEIGDDGRILVRGPMVSPGYVGEPERSGWFATGDVGRLDGGRLTVLGRADSVIVTGGENVHPEMVAAAVRSHPGVRDVRVFGIPDTEWGQVVAAEVVTDLTAEELDALAAALPPPMRPRRWRIVAAISGKLDGDVPPPG
jgi:O-succinylbenzoic acid--CoA ligase